MTEESGTQLDNGEKPATQKKPAIVIKRKAVVLIAVYLLSVVVITGTIMFTLFRLNLNPIQNTL